MKKIENKVAIVTGGTSGIGAGICRVYGENGAKVVVAGRNTERGEKVVSDIISKGGEAIFVQTDVSVEEDISGLVEKTVNKYGRLDIMVNNAGITEPCLIEEMTSEIWDKILNANAKSVLMGMKYSVPHLRKTKGSIINISSMASIKPLVLYSAYCASKAAVSMLTEVAALEYAADGICCNAICPGPVETPIRDSTPEERKKATEASIPLKRIGYPKDVAGLALFLATEDSKWITGNNFRVDGGITLL